MWRLQLAVAAAHLPICAFDPKPCVNTGTTCRSRWAHCPYYSPMLELTGTTQSDSLLLLVLQDARVHYRCRNTARPFGLCLRSCRRRIVYPHLPYRSSSCTVCITARFVDNRVCPDSTFTTAPYSSSVSQRYVRNTFSVPRSGFNTTLWFTFCSTYILQRGHRRSRWKSLSHATNHGDSGRRASCRASFSICSVSQ